MLSHDLLEGSLTRTAFLNDVTFYDSQPSTFQKWWKRQHRWIRGDWQLLPFIFGGERYKKPHHGARAIMLHNIFRSLRDVSTLLLIFIAVVFKMPVLLLLTLVAYVFEPLKEFIPLAAASIKNSTEMYQWRLLSLRTAMELITLPYAAFKSADAIIRTLIRLTVTHKNMLEWQTAACDARASGSYPRDMLVCPAAGILLAVTAVAQIVAEQSAGAAQIAAPVLAVLWSIAPLIVRVLNQRHIRKQLSEEETAELLSLFGGTRRFFTELCSKATNGLPPDNVQEQPKKPPVGVTSPTNMGMALLAATASYDMGFADAESTVKTLADMIESIENAPKWHGNMFNWYRIADITPVTPRFISSVDSGNLTASLMTTAQALREINSEAAAMLAKRCDKLVAETELEALYDKQRKLFRIGYDFEEGRYTDSWYDLYASEARLTSFVAIALSKVGQEHWQRLSRVMTEAKGGRTLLSWSGTMFEYLMPLLFFETAEGSLQHEICLSAVRTQLLCADDNMPWGVSESGYYCFDKAMYYQYRAFGIAELGLEPKHEAQNVIAPYASALALMLEPHEAAENLRRLHSMGMVGSLGMYEAADFTSGMPQDYDIVKSFMAHHQGMTLAAINETLHDRPLSRRFMRIPCVRAYETLLFESMPTKPIVLKEYESSVCTERSLREAPKPARIIDCERVFDGQLISNGSYSVMVFSNGGGWSKQGDTMLTRWRRSDAEPPHNHAEYGVAALLSTDGIAWECNKRAELSEHKAVLIGGRGGLDAKCTITVAADCDAEIRTLNINNRGRAEKKVRVGFFAEPCLVPQNDDMAHAAFVKLTVNSEKEGDITLFRLRPKSGRREMWLFISVTATNVPIVCTDAYTVPSRLKSPRDAVNSQMPSETIPQSPIEPYYSAMTELTIEAGGVQSVCFIMGAAPTRDAAIAAYGAVKAGQTREEALIGAVTAGIRKSVGLASADVMRFEPLAARIAAEIPLKPRASREEIETEGGVPALWGMGISGDYPILLVRVSEVEQLREAKAIARFAELCTLRGLKFDLVFLGMYPNEYGNRVRQGLVETVRAARVHLIDACSTAKRQQTLLNNIALICCDADKLPCQSVLRASDTDLPTPQPAFLPIDMPDTFCFNGYGGFDTKDENQYVIISGGSKSVTPAPWSNILANQSFGTLVTENGGGYTWAQNSRLMRLTPWSNDPLRDPCGERVSVIAEGKRICITPCDPNGMFKVEHGIGTTRFTCNAEGLSITLTEMADASESVKYYNIAVKNCRLTQRSIRFELSVDWVLGEVMHREAVGTYSADGILYAKNARDSENDGYYAFLCAGDGVCGDNTVFSEFALREGESVSKTILLGYGTKEQIAEYVRTKLNEFEIERERVKMAWRGRLGRLHIETGDKAFDMLVNGILLYQTYSSRLFAKTGFYQSGGANGFRDQLQDVCALLLTDPATARAQLISAAAKQFKRGDVLHWWHNDGRGVRTRMSDDRLFLPYTVMRYCDAAADTAIWDERVPFLAEAPIPQDKSDLYTVFSEDEEGTMFEHCVAAIEASMCFGAHGLPLMGAGDWNDSMDKVGENGGESVWLGWFLLYVLEKFQQVCADRGFNEKSEEYSSEACRLRAAIEKWGWDGAWYKRAFYGDGVPLGSSQNDECAIDAIAQCWAVFNNAERSHAAFDAVCGRLVDEKNGILKLLSPSFSDSGVHRAGYIEAYAQGVRENGGQYTHAAAWAVIAAARLGDAKRASELFRMINPIEHGTAMQINRYRTEPYAVAGDVYSEDENAGRGGWTWYTGAAGWLYQAAVEHILGLKKKGNRLYIEPVTVYPHFSVEYKYEETSYRIEASAANETSIIADGKRVVYVELVNDGATHTISVTYMAGDKA